MASAAFWLVAAVVLLAEAAIVIAALRMRVTPDPSRGVLGTRPLEIVWTLLPTLLAVFLVFVSYNELRGG